MGQQATYGLSFQFLMAFAGLALLFNQNERRRENCLIVFGAAQSHKKMKTQPVRTLGQKCCPLP
jgi:hypothetical protein